MTTEYFPNRELEAPKQSVPGLQPVYQHQAPSTAAAGQTRKKYTCEACGKLFQRLVSSYYCFRSTLLTAIANFAACRPSSLRNHMTSHSGERPHGCPYPGCNKRYSTRSNMQRHATVHASPGTATPCSVGVPCVVSEPMPDGSWSLASSHAGR
ncbi:uncharacterized protein PHACADRAFT_88447 [Phanerochaete carnosa HHB-10118-sp]|uniref:C2H2-type domain-containing protein n=1 Tax=Phanerochaete carnosa (strain HHB-10118-sp) TaxID=650164 RepID=K5V7V1_PHACS|nr:uncharacterized protein PHACADRAFT_88447 [Phanerochaete carnosa HHB-10118-sp]EKM58821.1 hypothetical protein PHACADRAFT_88447 [Phanerochaete carnosa HHB-10118-sp]